MILVFGPYDCVGKMIDTYSDTIVLNLTSLKEGYDRLNLIPPFDNSIFMDNKLFDMEYAKYLLNNEYAFCELMNVIYSLYNERPVYIMVSVDMYSCDYIAESLQKFISARYGIISNNVSELDDIDYIQDSRFSFDGLHNLDDDKKRYIEILIRENKIQV